MTQVLILAELLPGHDQDGNARVLIPYTPNTCEQHSRVRFVDPATILTDRNSPPDAPPAGPGEEGGLA